MRIAGSEVKSLVLISFNLHFNFISLFFYFD